MLTNAFIEKVLMSRVPVDTRKYRYRVYRDYGGILDDGWRDVIERVPLDIVKADHHWAYGNHWAWEEVWSSDD